MYLVDIYMTRPLFHASGIPRQSHHNGTKSSVRLISVAESTTVNTGSSTKSWSRPRASPFRCFLRSGEPIRAWAVRDAKDAALLYRSGSGLPPEPSTRQTMHFPEVGSSSRSASRVRVRSCVRIVQLCLYSRSTRGIGMNALEKSRISVLASSDCACYGEVAPRLERGRCDVVKPGAQELRRLNLPDFVFDPARVCA